MKEMLIVLGMLLGYFMGYLFQDTAGGWRITLASLSYPHSQLCWVSCCYPPAHDGWLSLVDPTPTSQCGIKCTWHSAACTRARMYSRGFPRRSARTARQRRRWSGRGATRRPTWDAGLVTYWRWEDRAAPDVSI